MLDALITELPPWPPIEAPPCDGIRSHFGNSVEARYAALADELTIHNARRELERAYSEIRERLAAIGCARGDLTRQTLAAVALGIWAIDAETTRHELERIHEQRAWAEQGQ